MLFYTMKEAATARSIVDDVAVFLETTFFVITKIEQRGAWSPAPLLYVGTLVFVRLVVVSVKKGMDVIVERICRTEPFC